MQNIIYAVIGIILTVATLAMVAPAINGAAGGMNTRMMSTEVGAINNTARMWVATQSANNTFLGMTNAGLGGLIPDLPVNAAGTLQSRANNAVTYSVAVAANGLSYVLTIAGVPAVDQATLVAALNATFPVPAAVVAAAVAGNNITITLR